MSRCEIVVIKAYFSHLTESAFPEICLHWLSDVIDMRSELY